MNIQLRKRHKRMWGVIYFLVVFVGYMVLDKMPENPIADIPMTYCPVGMTSCTDSHEDYDSADLFVWHTENGDNTTIVKIDLQRPLKSTFSTVYLEGSDRSILLGKIEEMRSYTFEVPKHLIQGANSIEIRDELKKTVFDTKSINELMQ